MTRVPPPRRRRATGPRRHSARKSGRTEIAQRGARRSRAGSRPCAACRAAPASRSSARSVPASSKSSSGLVARHPALEDGQVLRVPARIGERHLVRAIRALDLLAVDDLRPGPSLSASRGRSSASAAVSGTPFVRASVWMVVGCRATARSSVVGHEPVHALRVVAARRSTAVAVATEELTRAPRRSMRARIVGFGDLVAVQVQDRQHGAVARGVQELVRRASSVASGPVSASPSPTTQATIRSGLSKAAPNACDSAVAELAALVDRARRLGRHVARNAAGKRELP